MALKATAFPRREVIERHFKPWARVQYQVTLSCGHTLELCNAKSGKAKTVACYKCPQVTPHLSEPEQHIGGLK